MFPLNTFILAVKFMMLISTDLVYVFHAPHFIKFCTITTTNPCFQSLLYVMETNNNINSRRAM